MNQRRAEYKILVVEDNPGDFALVEDFLLEKIERPVIINAENFTVAKDILSLNDNKFDVILLDLSLPDKKGEALIEGMMGICLNAPVIVLTGYADFDFGVKSLSLGIADYILKDELTALSLYKSIVYCLERKKNRTAIEASEKKYSELFHLSPLPMWVVDVDTLRFLDVNNATLNHYGYTREEFLLMTLKDITPVGELPSLEKRAVESRLNAGRISKNVVIHKKKNGEVRNVEIQVAPLQFKEVSANIVIATDVTERLNYTKAIEEQNKKLKEIAWMQSHVVRAPLARIMGLIQLMNDSDQNEAEKAQIIEYILFSAHELDGVIKDITDKTGAVKF